MGIDWYMCDVCGECKVEYDFTGIEFTNAEYISICDCCYKNLKGYYIKPAEKYKADKKTKEQSESESESDSEDEYKDYYGEWKVVKEFDIIEKVRKPIKFTKEKEKKTLEK